MGSLIATKLMNRSRSHRVWVLVSMKAHVDNPKDSMYQVLLEPGFESPEGVDVDFVRAHESSPEIRFGGTSAGPGNWWKIGARSFGPIAAIDDGPGSFLLLSMSGGSVTAESGEEIAGWNVKRNTWPGVSDGRQAVRIPSVTPPPPPPSTPAPPSGPKPGTPPPSSATPPPSSATPPPPKPGPPPQGLPPAAWLTGVQARLKYLAYYAGPIHDKFDTPTRNAVLAFQGKHGLKVDGIPGPKTQTKLVEVVGA